TYDCGTNVTCNGATDGSIALDLTGGCEPYTYSWTGPGGFTSTSEDLSGLGAGTYNVTVTDDNGCSLTDEITLTEPDELLVADLSSPTYDCGTNVTCNDATDGSIALDLTGGCEPYTYSWTGPGGFTSTSEDLSGLGAGTYSVTVTDDNGCSLTDEITLTQPDELLVADLSSPEFECGFNVTCNGATDGSVNLDLTGGCEPYTYNWTGPNGYTSATEDLASLETGTYNVTVTDANGCSLTDEITLTQPDELLVTTLNAPEFECGYNISCFGATDGSINLDLSGGCEPYTYSWSGPNGYSASAEDISSLEAGTYNVTVTDANGCSLTDEITLTQPNELVIVELTSPEFNGGWNISCFGEDDGSISITVSGGADCLAYDYQWAGSNGFTSTLEDLNDLLAGTYDVTVTDANGCVATGVITLEEPAELVATAIGETVFCQNIDEGDIDLTVNGGTTPYTFDWDNDGTGDADDSEDLSNLSPGIYAVTVTDANGCVTTSEAEIILEDNLVAIMSSAPDTLCTGEQGIFEAFDDGTGATFTWNFGIGATPPSATGPGPHSVEYANAGDALVSLTVELNGCIDQLDSTITVIQTPELSNVFTTDPTCTEGGSIFISSVFDPAGFEYNIGDGTGWHPGMNIFTNLPAGVYNISVRTIDGYCEVQGSTVELFPPPPISILDVVPTDETECDEEDGTLTITLDEEGTAPYFVTYSFGGSTVIAGLFTQSPFVLTGLPPGTYSNISITDDNDCVATAPGPYEIIEAGCCPEAIISAVGPNPACTFETVTFTGVDQGPDAVYIWDFGADAIPPVSNSIGPVDVQFSTPGVKTVTLAVILNGCTVITSTTVTINEPVAEIEPIPQTCEGEGVLIQAVPVGPGGSYMWDFGADADPPTSTMISETVIYSSIGDKTVTLIITDAQGCSATTTAIAQVDPPVIAEPGPDRIICQGETIQLGAPNANYPDGAVFQWVPADGLDDPFAEQPMATPLSTIEYSLFVTFGNCVSTADITVNVDVVSVPFANAGINQIICAGEPLTLGGMDPTPTGPEGAAYFWTANPPDPTLIDVFDPNPVVYPTEITTYTVTVVRNGCSRTDEVEVLVIPTTPADAGEDQTFCAGDGPVTIGTSSNPFFTYSWSPMDGLTNPGGPGGIMEANPEYTTVYTLTQTDASGCSTTDQVAVIVIDCNDPPMAIHDINNTLIDIPVPGFVLTNDFDINGHNLTVTEANGLIVDPAGTTFAVEDGSVTIFPDGSYIYTPDIGFIGTNHFTYVVCDDGMPGPKCDTANVTLEVRENVVGNDLPIANDDVTFLPQNFLGTSNLLDNDDDPDGDSLILNLTPINPPDHGNVSLNPEGVYTFFPTFGFEGEDTFVYEVCDEGGLCDTATVTIIVFRVPPANNPATAVDDSNVTEANVPVSGNVLPNDYDPDNDVLTVNSVPTDPPDNGTVVLNADGSYTYTPNPGFTGTDMFTYQMCDPSNLCDQATVTITVYSQLNSPPVAGDDYATTEPGLAVDFDLKPNDYDPDEDVIIYSLTPITPPANGTLAMNPDGTVRYTAGVTFIGTDQFEYEICDNISGCDTATVTVEVFDETINNDPPVATNDVNGTPEGSPVSGNVTTNDVDPEEDPLTVTTTLIDQPDNGTVTVDANGEYTYTPNAGFIGTDTFVYETCDGVAGCDQASVIIVVYSQPPVNDPPVAQDDYNSAQVSHPSTGNVLGNDYDINGDQLIVTPAPITLPDNGSLTFNTDGSYIYIPDQGYFGIDTFTYEICDTHGLCDQADVIIDVYPFPYQPITNNLRPFAGDDAAATFVNVPVIGGIMHSNDVDPDIISMTYNTTPIDDVDHGSVIIYADGTYDYTPNPGYIGPDQFIYEVCDGAGECVFATVYITVFPNNTAPVAIDDFNNTLGEIAVDGNVLTNDYDNEGNNLIVTTINGQVVDPGGTTILTGNGGVTIYPDGSYTFTPLPGFLGEETFVYEICDDGVPGPLCHEATVTITVFTPASPVNNPPVANVDATETEINTPVEIFVLTNDYDPDGDILTSPIQTSLVSNGTVSLNGNSFIYTPFFNFVGKDTFYYATCDPFGLCDDAMVTIVVSRDDELPNDPPVAVDDAVYTPVNVSVSGNASLNDIDPDGDTPLTFTNISLPDHGGLVFNNDGSFTYTPDPDYSGPDQFIYEVCDGISSCDYATVYIVVGPRNDPPIAIDDINNTLVNIPVGGQVLTNDYDPNGDIINVTEVNGNPVQPSGTTVSTPNGSVTINEDGTYTYTPNPGYLGTDQFTYTVCDNGVPGPLCTDATVTIEIFSPEDPINNPPIANDDATETEMDNPVTINIVANDYDPDGDILQTPTQTSIPSNGSVTQNPDGSFVYTPDSGFVGEDSFTYTVCDLDGLCDDATVTIVVTPDNDIVNDPPIAVDDVVYTPFNTEVSGDASLNDYDPEGDAPLTFTALTPAANGSLVFNPDGSFTYSPDDGFSGPDQFTYEVCDGVSGCDYATVYIVVGPRNDPPVAVNDDNNTFMETPVSGALLTNDYDPNNDLITFAGIEIVAIPGVFVQTPVFLPGINDLGMFVANAGNIVPNPDGTYIFVPNTGFTGTVQATYKICDNGIPGPMCDEGILTVIVTPADQVGNKPPIANDDDNITEIDTPVSGTVISNDSDHDGDVLTITGFESGNSYLAIVNLPEGTFEFTNPGTPGNGDYTFTPAAGFTGEVTIEYEICDLNGSGVCTTAELTVIVLPDDGRINGRPFAGDDFTTATADQTNTGNWFDNDGDPNNDPLVINGFGMPINPNGSPTPVGTYPTLNGGTITFNNNGTFIYMPAPGYIGPDQVTYQICEVGTLELYCANATVYLLVMAGNAPPVAINDFNNTLQDIEVTGSVMTNDYDPENDELTATGFTTSFGGPYSLTIVLPGQGTLTLTDPSTGAYTFVPEPGFIGTTDPVEYQVCDSGVCSVATLVIEVIEGTNPVNVPPVANDDHNQTLFETGVGGNILENDFDPDEDSFTITGGGTTGFSTGGGTWSLNPDGSYLYLPAFGYTGLDTLFIYEICDGISGCDEAVATVTVHAESGELNNPPVAVDDGYNTDFNVPIMGANVTGNDPDDPDGDATSVVSINGAFINMAGTTITTLNGGTVLIYPDGTFNYDPATDYSGPDHFIYELCDGISGCDFATVYITVLPEICIEVTVAAYLQGAYLSGTNSMRTDLGSARMILPGQTPVNPLAIPTPPGNPYREMPWDYDGTTAEENYTGPYTNAQGLNVVDWVLISLRSTPSKIDEFSRADGLLYEDGTIEFIKPCILTSSDPEEVWIVIEHRNHMAAMSDTAVTVNAGTLVYDFRITDSYRTNTSFGQAQVEPGVYALFAGDADQGADFPGYDINGLDNIVWTQENGNFDQYLRADFDLNGDVNGADIILWSQNNGLSSAVPKD
ncbi:MAG: Ig-like domain-containing protein, partial [Bacteroidota bacterium]